MSELNHAEGSTWTAMDLVTRFGAIPLHRICQDPPPGTASKEDVIRLHDRTNRLFELIDGTLVEKVMGTYESYLAQLIARWIGNFVDEHQLGVVLGADGMMEMAPNLVRIPDVSFISWNRFPGADQFAEQAIADIVPDLAVEVISRSNTDEEMTTKLHEYFRAGVQLVWYVYPDQKSLRVFSSPDHFHELRTSDRLEGGEVLPGFCHELSNLFRPPAKPGGE